MISSKLGRASMLARATAIVFTVLVSCAVYTDEILTGCVDAECIDNATHGSAGSFSGSAGSMAAGGSGGVVTTGGTTGAGGSTPSGGSSGSGGTGGGNEAGAPASGAAGESAGGAPGEGGAGGTEACDDSGVPIVDLDVHDTSAPRAAHWSIEDNLQLGASGTHPWGDWPNTYLASVDSAGMFLVGSTYVATAAESKQYMGGAQATLTLNPACTYNLYMLVDDQWTSTSWTSGWTNTGWNFSVYQDAGKPALPFSVYVKTNQSGSVDLPMINGLDGYNYIIVVD